MSDDEFVPQKKKESPKKATKKATVTKKTTKVSNNGEPSTKRPAKKAVVKKKPEVEIIDLSDDEDIPVSKPRIPRGTVTKTKRKYSSSDSDDLFKTATSNSMLIYLLF